MAYFARYQRKLKFAVHAGTGFKVFLATNIDTTQPSNFKKYYDL